MDLGVGHRVAPLQRLPVQVGVVGETDAGPHIAADVLHPAFDSALRLRPVGLARPNLKAGPRWPEQPKGWSLKPPYRVALGRLPERFNQRRVSQAVRFVLGVPLITPPVIPAVCAGLCSTRSAVGVIRGFVGFPAYRAAPVCNTQLGGRCAADLSSPSARVAL